jgi:lipopolysaccharide/colanic/teichoic acid biosynthesis glycosyltransferase
VATERITLGLPQQAEWTLDAVQPFPRSLGRQWVYEAVKRALDVVVAASALLALLPLVVVVGIAILLETGWPVIYRGERVGRFGRRFSVAKFRSMRSGCSTAPHEKYVRDLMHGDAPEGEAVYKVPNDDRITPLGRFLRRTSIDELPQLWNVLRGDMSLVGPRPDLTSMLAEYDDALHRRLLVRPGITGLWQVSGRSRLSLRQMYQLDLEYVSKASLALDLRILARTVPVVLGCDGAR